MTREKAFSYQTHVLNLLPTFVLKIDLWLCEIVCDMTWHVAFVVIRGGGGGHLTSADDLNILITYAMDKLLLTYE